MNMLIFMKEKKLVLEEYIFCRRMYNGRNKSYFKTRRGAISSSYELLSSIEFANRIISKLWGKSLGFKRVYNLNHPDNAK